MCIHHFKQLAILPTFSLLQPALAYFPLLLPRLTPSAPVLPQPLLHCSALQLMAVLRLVPMMELIIQRAPQIHSHLPWQLEVGGPPLKLKPKLAILAQLQAVDLVVLLVAAQGFMVRCLPFG
jgi:hypothetical protein